MYANTTDPMKLPMYTKIQRFITCIQLILWMNAAIGASIASPVKSSAPVRTVMISPTGKTAPRINCAIPADAKPPGTAPAVICAAEYTIPVLQTVARAAPMAIYAPDMNPRRTMFHAGKPTLYLPASPAFAVIATGG
jgi:hypothetical protein